MSVAFGPVRHLDDRASSIVPVTYREKFDHETCAICQKKLVNEATKYVWQCRGADCNQLCHIDCIFEKINWQLHSTNVSAISCNNRNCPRVIEKEDERKIFFIVIGELRDDNKRLKSDNEVLKSDNKRIEDLCKDLLNKCTALDQRNANLEIRFAKLEAENKSGKEIVAEQAKKISQLMLNKR